MNAICFKVPRLREETVRVEFWELPHFYQSVHFHEECQITLILKGRGGILVGTRLDSFREGDLFFIGKNQPHVLRNDTQSNNSTSRLHVRAISIFFSLDTFVQILDHVPEALNLKNLIEQSKYGFKVCSKEANKLAPDIKMICHEKGVFKILRFIRILEVLSECQHLDQLTYSTPFNTGHTDTIKLNRVFNYIMENYQRRVTLEEVADLASMTPNAFCRFFKFRTNKTFTGFMIEFRIHQACKMLSSGNHNVTETYFSCGYNNSSNFHRHFRLHTGFTPTEYLCKIQNQPGLTVAEGQVTS